MTRALRWLAAAGLAGISFAAAGFTLSVIPLLYLAAVTPELMRIDLREHRLPNALVLPGIGIGMTTWAVTSLATGSADLAPVIAAVAFAGFLLLLCLLGGIGMGDVKLAAALGLASWVPFVAVATPVIGFLLGGVAGFAMLVRRRFHEGNGKRVAFGPFLLAGLWAAIALMAWARFA